MRDTTGETLVSKAPFQQRSDSALPSPNPMMGEGQVAESGLGRELPSPLGYFHKPIIADHLGRLRPCLSPIQPGRQEGSWAPTLLLSSHRDQRHHPVALGTRGRSQAGRSLGLGWGVRGAHRCPHLHPVRGQGAEPGRAYCLRSRAPGLSCHQRGGANEMQMQAEGRASGKAGPAVRTREGLSV